MHTGTVHLWEISIPSAQFCCEPKAALKNKVYPRKNKNYCTEDVIFSKVLYKIISPWYPTRIMTILSVCEERGKIELGNCPSLRGHPTREALAQDASGSRSKPCTRLCSDPTVTTNPKYIQVSSPHSAQKPISWDYELSLSSNKMHT